MEITMKQPDDNIFCKKIEGLVDNGMTYIESVILSCEQFGISPETGARLLSKPIIEKIQQEGESINLLPKKSKLPI
jgi:hypothetical protein